MQVRQQILERGIRAGKWSMEQLFAGGVAVLMHRQYRRLRRVRITML